MTKKPRTYGEVIEYRKAYIVFSFFYALFSAVVLSNLLFIDQILTILFFVALLVSIHAVFEYYLIFLAKRFRTLSKKSNPDSTRLLSDFDFFFTRRVKSEDEIKLAHAKDRVLGYELHKKIIIILTPIVIGLMLFYHSVTWWGLISHELAISILSQLQIGFASFAIMLLASMNPIFILKKEFRYYFAKTCFMIIQMDEKLSQNEKTKYFIMGLNAYEAYLKRNFDLQFKDISEIYSKSISDDCFSIDETVKKLNEIDDRNTKLDLAKCLRKRFPTGDKEEFLENERRRGRILTYTEISLPTITVLISIIQLLLKQE